MDRSIHLCKKTVTTPAKCANCCKEHLSINEKCGMNPNGKKLAKENKDPWYQKKNTSAINVWQKKTEERQLENANKGKQKLQELYQHLGEMIAEMIKLNPTREQKLNLFRKVEKIIKLFESK